MSGCAAVSSTSTGRFCSRKIGRPPSASMAARCTRPAPSYGADERGYAASDIGEDHPFGGQRRLVLAFDIDRNVKSGLQGVRPTLRHFGKDEAAPDAATSANGR